MGIQPVDILLALHLVKKNYIWIFCDDNFCWFLIPAIYHRNLPLCEAKYHLILLVFIYKIATPSLIFQAFKEEVLILLLLGNLD